jgi:hypothetical protein
MTQTILIYASRRERSRLSRQGYDVLAEYEDYVLVRASGEQVDQLRQRGYEVEVYRSEPAAGLGFEAAQSPYDPGPSTYGPGEHYYLVNFAGPIKPEWCGPSSSKAAACRSQSRRMVTSLRLTILLTSSSGKRRTWMRFDTTASTAGSVPTCL